MTLSIMSTVRSTVSLLAIDQRVLLLKTGNDLSLNEVFGDLDKYNRNGLDGYSPIEDKFLPRRPWWYSERYEDKFEVRC